MERQEVVHLCVCVHARALVDASAQALACPCVRVALLSQHATRCHIAICGLWLHQMLRHYLINGTIFGKNVPEYKMCILIFSTTFIWNISHSKQNSARFIGRFSEKTRISNFTKIYAVGAELFHAGGRSDGRTDWHGEANSRFSQFCERA